MAQRTLVKRSPLEAKPHLTCHASVGNWLLRFKKFTIMNDDLWSTFN